MGSADPLWDPPLAPEGRTATVVSELVRTPENTREVLETSAVDARPLRVAQLPGPSLWPLGVALAIAGALIGALVYSPLVALSGAAVAVVGLIGWAASTVREAPVEADAERILPVWRSGAGWWGHRLLGPRAPVRAGLPAVRLPAAGLRRRRRLGPGGRARPGHRLAAARRRARGRLIAALGCALLLDAATLALTGAGLASMDVAPTANAYGSVVAALVGFPMLLAGALAVVLAVVLYQALERRIDERRHVSLRVAALFALFVAATWLVVSATVWATPRLVA